MSCCAEEARWGGRRAGAGIAAVALLLVAPVAQAQKARGAAAPYVPPAGSWERRAPMAVGMDSVKLADAVAFAMSKESRTPRDLELNHLQSFGREPLGDAIGPLPPRGAAAGVIVRKGYVVATWGDPTANETTNSVTKSFLSTVVGLAVDDGRIRSVRDTVAPYMPPIVRARPNGTAYGRDWPGTDRLLMPFDTPHNRTITWDDLLRQTSDWEGTLWGKPEWADRPAPDASTWTTRARRAPGSSYEYNDTRVNVLALAALQVWRRPLPEVLKERIMDPIGASHTWRWYGYDNSWIVLDGREVQSVSGGGHWGGGMVLNAWDMARFGLLTLRRGNWGGKQLLSESWVAQALTPTPTQRTYGYMNWFVNPERTYLKAAPEQAFVHVGAGNNFIYVDPANDVVAVIRWMDTNASLNTFVEKLLGSLR
ncbi:serine hydrolase [Gemmatimonas sp.]|uniref:serine hydrolase domain-containing protein n=1 Tax=Gemmatimonas sp. TaxID=1962908 RepID=UPI0022CC5F76|nr:serine hydrolase [Gemmatimonas sp.]MCZ8206045.1 serine hydrolase [Gemmatimonas sp.]